jgi:hypothetical protein
MSRSRDLERRRLALREQIAAERELLGAEIAAIENRLAVVDRVTTRARSLLNHPAILLVGVAAFALIGPSRILGFVSRSVVLITAAKRVVKLLR